MVRIVELHSILLHQYELSSSPDASLREPDENVSIASLVWLQSAQACVFMLTHTLWTLKHWKIYRNPASLLALVYQLISSKYSTISP